MWQFTSSEVFWLWVNTELGSLGHTNATEQEKANASKPYNSTLTAQTIIAERELNVIKARKLENA